MSEPSGVQERITAFWNAVAPSYDAADNVATPGTDDYRRWGEALRAVLPPPPARVLDAGTGTGFVARLAAELGHHVTAIDLSPAMLDSSAVSRETELEIAFTVGDAVDPPFQAASFDAVVSRSLLWTLREPARAFASWFRLLRPGGRVVAIYGLSSSAEEASHQRSDEEQSAANADFFTRHYTPAVRAALPAIELRDCEWLFRVAAEAGLCDVRAIPLEVVRGWETSPGSDLPYALVGRRPSAVESVPITGTNYG